MATQAGIRATSKRRAGSLIRLAIGAATAGLLLTGAAIVVHDEAIASPDERFVVTLGDRIGVDAAPIGCRVTRLAGHGRRAYVECRRTGALEGTYGVFFSGKDVLVARFLDSREARVVFRRSHSGSAGNCG
jgi:hypothetical protein